MTDTAELARLADAFPAPDRQTWLGLVAKVLKGADFDKRLVARTADGLRIEPLYTRGETAAAGDCAPGAAPFTRGVRTAPEGLGWQIVQRHGDADPALANAAILEDLAGGANGVVLVIAAPGQVGTAVAGSDAMVRALTGVDLDLAPVRIEAGLDGLARARDLLAALPRLTARPASARVGLGLDPLGTLARHGALLQPLAAEMAAAARLAVEATAVAPAATAFVADGAIFHEAGASEALELAALAASLIAELRALEAAGMPPAEAIPRIVIRVAVDTDLFLGIAKLRAARRIVARIAEACGAGAAAARMRLAATTSQRMMSRRDPWVNLLRTTAACTAAAFGGADEITVLPFTHALGQADAFARRIARNTQIVLQEESGLGRVVDPAGGAWSIEALTDALAAKAWSELQEIEAEGGMAASLASAHLLGRIEAVADARAKSIATGRAELTGVSAFPLLAEDGVSVAPWPTPAPVNAPRQVRPLPQIRLAAPFEDLRDRADAHAARVGAPPRVFLASLGGVADHGARTNFMRNALAAGGIATPGGEGYADPAAAAAAFAASGASVACLCGSDAAYDAQAEAAARALKAAGATRVLLAGRPGEKEPAYRAAGIDGFVFAGGDALAMLAGLHAALGVA